MSPRGRQREKKPNRIAIDLHQLTARLFPESVAAATTADAGLFIAVVVFVAATAAPLPLAKNEEIVRWPEEARGADIVVSSLFWFSKCLERDCGFECLSLTLFLFNLFILLSPVREPKTTKKKMAPSLADDDVFDPNLPGWRPRPVRDREKEKDARERTGETKRKTQREGEPAPLFFLSVQK